MLLKRKIPGGGGDRWGMDEEMQEINKFFRFLNTSRILIFSNITLQTLEYVDLHSSKTDTL